MRLWARLDHRLDRELAQQRGHLMLWVPVGFACGVGLYFALPQEPTRLHLGLAAALCLLAGLAGQALWRRERAAGALLLVLALVAAGLGWAGLRSRMVDEPVLGFRYYGPIEGRIVGIDRSSSDALRLTLDQVRLSRVPPHRTPARVRVSHHSEIRYGVPRPGDRVMMTGHLSPPGGPVEPGGFDFQRHAWFLKLGAVGYSRTPLMRAEMRAGGAPVAALRMRLSRAIQAAIPGAVGAFAAAITTGDRSGMPKAIVDDLRRSNLAHLLAISGLHMGLLTSTVFAFTRGALALMGRRALVWPVKQIAAVVALVAGAVYLALSGAPVSTERAFIMAAVVLGAVMLGRRALTLRAVATAAMIVLLLRPEALTGPGFQMSFAATAALVAVFSGLRGRLTGVPGWAQGLLAVVLSSLVAGLATAPFAAAHFNQVSRLGLVANVVSVPVMGALIMPAALVALLLAPLGLAKLGLFGMEIGLRWILFVAHGVGGREFAVGHVVSPPAGLVALIGAGLAVLALWQGRGRWLGALICLVAFAMWSQARRPDLLVAESGGLFGVMTPAGRALSRERGDGFAAQVWLENDGAPVPQETAAERWTGGETVELGATRLRLVRGKRAFAALKGCGGADILVTNISASKSAQDWPCVLYDAKRLRQTGALALWSADDGLTIEAARHRTGHRIWNRTDRR